MKTRKSYTTPKISFVIVSPLMQGVINSVGDAEDYSNENDLFDEEESENLIPDLWQ